MLTKTIEEHNHMAQTRLDQELKDRLNELMNKRTAGEQKK